MTEAALLNLTLRKVHEAMERPPQEPPILMITWDGVAYPLDLESADYYTGLIEDDGFSEDRAIRQTLIQCGIVECMCLDCGQAGDVSTITRRMLVPADPGHDVLDDVCSRCDSNRFEWGMR